MMMRGLRGNRCINIFFIFFLLTFDLIYISTISADLNVTNISGKIVIVSRFGGDYTNIQKAINEANEGSIIFIKNLIFWYQIWT